METESIIQPQAICVSLFDHQLKSMEAMHDLEKSGKVSLSATDFLMTSVGCLSDIGGYGKTLSVLGLIARTQHDLDNNQIEPVTFFRDEIRFHKYIQRVSITPLTPVGCSLVLVNVSLLTQWQQELNRTTLRHKILYSKAEIDNPLNISDYDVIVVSATIYNLFTKVHLHKMWKRLIIDEPANTGILAIEKAHAHFYWLITSTPEELFEQKNKGLLAELIPNNYNDFAPVILRNDEEFVKRSFDMPKTEYIRYDCYSVSTFFQGIVNKTVFEMLESGNIAGAVAFYGGTPQTSIYDAYIQKKQKKINELLESGGSASVQRMRELRSDISTLQQRLPNCHTVTSCCHQFQPETEVPSGPTGACPFCREQGYVLLQVKANESNFFVPPKGVEVLPPLKINVLLKIVMDKIVDPTKKILIFSNHNETFSTIKRFLSSPSGVPSGVGGCSFLELKGTKTTRDNTLDAYKSGNTNILLLNTISGGSGLNLQETTDIIIYHTVNEFTNAQVISRALRIGRTRKLEVHYL